MAQDAECVWEGEASSVRLSTHLLLSCVFLVKDE